MIEKHFGRSYSEVIPELGFVVAVGKEELDNELIFRKRWLTDQTVNAIREDSSLKTSLVTNFPQVPEIFVDKTINDINNKGIYVRDYVPDFSVSDNRLRGAQEKWFQQHFIRLYLGDPMFRLIPDAEEVVPNLEESKEKGRLILSPAGLMVYEFEAFTDDEKYSGVFTQTSFISVHEVKRANSIITLGVSPRGSLNRYFDDKSLNQLQRYRKTMSERRKEAISTQPNDDISTFPRFEE